MANIICSQEDLSILTGMDEFLNEIANKIEHRQQFYKYPEAEMIIKSHLFPRFKRADISSNDRGLIYFLYGDYHTGKSFLLKFFCGLMFTAYPHMWQEEQIPIVRINLNNHINTAIQLLIFLLDKLGRPITHKLVNEWKKIHIAKERLQNRLITHLERCGTRILILDECQKLLNARNPNVPDIFELLKDLSTKSNWNGDLCTQIVMCGTKDGVPLLEAADWIQGRTRTLKLHPLNEREFGSFLFKVYSDFTSLGISQKWALVDMTKDHQDRRLNPEVALYLYKRTGGKIGLTIDLLRYAVLLALDDGRYFPEKRDYEAIQLTEKSYRMKDVIKPIKKTPKKSKIRVRLQDRTCQMKNCVREHNPYATYRSLVQHYRRKHPHMELSFEDDDDQRA
jgi:hypothetical protein